MKRSLVIFHNVANKLLVPPLLALILLYRYSLSFFFGRTCRHLPTCSEYAMQALKKYGVIKGGWLALKRFWRCRPGGSHGFDPVP
jgi:putative membrane protein insertion efficiency factor